MCIDMHPGYQSLVVFIAFQEKLSVDQTGMVHESLKGVGDSE
jgi:hypothetical protein